MSFTTTLHLHAVRLLAMFAAALLAGCASAPPKPAELARGDYRYARDYISWLVEREMRDNNIAGLSIGLVDGQQLVWAEGFGFEDVEKDIRASAHTRYRLGSIAKVLTATAAMQLAEQGRIDIDRPLGDYLPGFAIRSRFPGAGPVTPRNIMHHHSGLPSNHLNGMLGGEPAPIASLVGAVREDYLAYPPDFIFSYSNLAYTLLGASIEHMAGMPFARHMQRSLLEPLGMRDSSFESRPALKEYRKGQAVEPIALRDLPSGGLVSTVEDISRFMRMVLAEGRAGDRQLIRAETLAEMLRPQNEHVALDLDMRIGLGWMFNGLGVHHGGPVPNHGGTLLDSHSLMALLPEHDLGVVVMANSGSAQASVKKIVTELLTLALEAKTGLRPPPEPAPVASRATDAAAAADLSDYEAWYDSMVGLVRVNAGSSSLEAEALGHTFQLDPLAGGRFGLRYKLFGLIPVSVDLFDELRVSMTNIGEHEVLVGHVAGHRMLVGQRLEPSPIPRKLLDYVGEYEIVGAPPGGLVPDRLALRLEDGLLVGECSFSQMPGFVLRAALQPISETEAIISGLGTGKGETLRVIDDDGERRLLYSGLELRRKGD